MDHANRAGTKLGVIALIVILFVSFALMFYASQKSSPVMDELAHIPSGYSYVRFFDFRLNPEHPPLVKALAALPLLFYNLNFPTDVAAWTTAVNGQWDMGRAFLYDAGNDPDLIVHIARLGPMILFLLLIVLVYMWSRELMGPLWALLPTVMLAFSPSFLAHGEYVTTDVGASLGIAIGIYFFLKMLRAPSWKSVLVGGIAFGIAQLMKFSAVLLIPCLGLLAIVYALFLRGETGWRGRLRAVVYDALRTVAVFAIGFLLIVYPVYFLFTSHYPIDRQASDTTYILRSFAEGPTPPGETCKPVRCLADLNIWMSKHSATRPLAEYMIGVLMVVQRAAGGNTNYFLGTVSNEGSRWYFPAVYALKEPIPILILVLGWLVTTLLGGLKTVWRHGRRTGGMFVQYLKDHFTEFSLASFTILYWAYSMKSPLNIGFRHLFPSLPLLYILAANFWKKSVTRMEIPQARSPLQTLWYSAKALLGASFRGTLVLVLVVWLFFETMLTAPNFLSYFNQFGGGVWGGYRYVTDSNYDWGQDFYRLNDWMREHPEVKKIALDFFGGATPSYYLGDRVENWWSSRGNPKDEGIEWFATSINSIQGSIQPVVSTNGLTRNPADEYSWLTEGRKREPGLGGAPIPDFRAGTSIFIYKL